MKNMKRISNFTRVKMNDLKADNGGCIFVELSQNAREIPEVYNQDMYMFSDLELNSCMSKTDGAAFYIRNIRNMTIKGKKTLI